MVSHCARLRAVTRDVQNWRDERDAGMVYLVYLVGLSVGEKSGTGEKGEKRDMG